jgi:hypothetical protein
MSSRSGVVVWTDCQLVGTDASGFLLTSLVLASKHSWRLIRGGERMTWLERGLPTWCGVAARLILVAAALLMAGLASPDQLAENVSAAQKRLRYLDWCETEAVLECPPCSPSRAETVPGDLNWTTATTIALVVGFLGFLFGLLLAPKYLRRGELDGLLNPILTRRKAEAATHGRADIVSALEQLDSEIRGAVRPTLAP